MQLLLDPRGATDGEVQNGKAESLAAGAGD